MNINLLAWPLPTDAPPPCPPGEHCPVYRHHPPLGAAWTLDVAVLVLVLIAAVLLIATIAIFRVRRRRAARAITGRPGHPGPPGGGDATDGHPR